MTVDVVLRLAKKRVAVVGGGKTGAAAARLALGEGARVVLCDDAPDDKVRAGVAKHGLDAARVELRAGGVDADALAGADLVVLSPGVPRAHAAVQKALAAGVPVVNEMDLAAPRLVDTVFTAITGTNGKSTTTTMLGAIARARDPAAFVGGNLGRPLCEAVVAGERPRLGVVELSSYQLETITRLRLRSAAITNLTPDHLDRYPSADAYYAAKARVFELVSWGGGVALNRADPESRRALSPPGRLARCDFDVSPGEEGIEVGAEGLVVRRAGRMDFVPLTNPRIVGRHNRQNAAAAVACAALMGLPSSTWTTGLAAYAGIDHRLERVGTARGVAWFNDSKATNVDAAVTALESFSGGVHLIAGGLGKGAPYAPLVAAARGKVAAVYVVGDDAPRLKDAFEGIVDVVDAGTLEAACAAAMERARPGDVLLLSPACASFDQFESYAHRGDSFRRLYADYASGES